MWDDSKSKTALIITADLQKHHIWTCKSAKYYHKLPYVLYIFTLTNIQEHCWYDMVWVYGFGYSSIISRFRLTAVRHISSWSDIYNFLNYHCYEVTTSVMKHQGSLVQTWINFKHTPDKVWDHIIFLFSLYRWNMEMDIYLLVAFYNDYNYLSMLGLKTFYIGIRGP